MRDMRKVSGPGLSPSKGNGRYPLRRAATATAIPSMGATIPPGDGIIPSPLRGGGQGRGGKLRGAAYLSIQKVSKRTTS